VFEKVLPVPMPSLVVAPGPAVDHAPPQLNSPAPKHLVQKTEEWKLCPKGRVRKWNTVATCVDAVSSPMELQVVSAVPTSAHLIEAKG
jgi:hypothetical protein